MTSTSRKHSRDAWDVPNRMGLPDAIQFCLGATTTYSKARVKSCFIPDKSVVLKSVSDIKLMHAGKVLENGKTLAESRVHFGDLPGGVSTMHVVVQPPIPRKKTGCSSM